jgi:tripartite-type tricarboxylate transporter receptor subunit TctC
MKTRILKTLILRLLVLVSLAFWGALGTISTASAFPERTITIIVPYTPGGSTDLMARSLAQRLTEVWGHPVIISNQPGAGGSLGAARAAKSTADGYTWFMTTNSPLTTNLALYAGLAYDTMRDFEPVVMVADSPMLLVTHPKLPVTSVKEFIALAKKTPGKLLAGISGNGATTHLAIAEFSRLSGTKFTLVPYRGGAPMTTAMITGEEIQVSFNDIVPLLPLVRDGKLRAIATPQLRRSSVAPDVPTLDEAGMPGFNVTPWTAIFLPKGTPGDIVKRVNAEVNRIFSEPKFKARILSIGQDSVAPNTPEEFAAFVRTEIVRWRDMVRTTGVEITGMPQ